MPQIKTATGGGPVVTALQDKAAQAWGNSAKTGNPSQLGIQWKPCTPDSSKAMVFDTVSQCYALRDDKLVSLLPTASGRG